MQRYKSLLVISCLLLLLTACAKEKEFVSVESFERNFLKEEYDAQYAAINEEFKLTSGKEYQIEIAKELTEGSLLIKIYCDGTASEEILVENGSANNDSLAIPAGTKEIRFVIAINEDTVGKLKISLLAK